AVSYHKPKGILFTQNAPVNCFRVPCGLSFRVCLRYGYSLMRIFTVRQNVCVCVCVSVCVCVCVCESTLLACFTHLTYAKELCAQVTATKQTPWHTAR